MKNLPINPAWLKWINNQPLWLRLLIVLSAGALAFVVLMIVLSPPGFASEDPGETSLGTFGIAMELILSLGFIVILIFVFLNLMSRMRSGSWIQQSRKLKIIETTNLSQRQAIHMIKVGEKFYLVGATDNSISLLTEISDPEIDLSEPAAFNEALDIEIEKNHIGDQDEA